MPGHMKAGGSKEVDPDPAPFLIVSFEIKKEDSLKPYNANKSVWVPDGEGGYDEAMIDTVDGDKISCKVGNQKCLRVLNACMSILPRWRTLMMSQT